jgi:hypothetical protein
MSLKITQFPIIDTKVNTRNPDFAANVEKWQAITDQLDEALQASASQGHAKGQKRHVSRGQLLGALSQA